MEGQIFSHKKGNIRKRRWLELDRSGELGSLLLGWWEGNPCGMAFPGNYVSFMLGHSFPCCVLTHAFQQQWQLPANISTPFVSPGFSLGPRTCVWALQCAAPLLPVVHILPTPRKETIHHLRPNKVEVVTFLSSVAYAEPWKNHSVAGGCVHCPCSVEGDWADSLAGGTFASLGNLWLAISLKTLDTTVKLPSLPERK